ncbi:MAG: hypothetical protein IH977_05720 [Nitrospinae bacterium]|nr:hypothetical protein [Nitrospinota bacterium]
MTAQRIIIIGGGFAGVACAKTLRKRLSRDQWNASVRARTPVEVVVMGRNVFSQLSRSLTPLRNILIDTVTRRKAAQ